MADSDPLSHLSLLDEQLDDLTEALTPLLTTPGLQSLTSTLPIVDQARLSVLTVYTLESLLFTYLRLNGVDAKAHPVMTELARVRQYVDKINAAQAGPQKRAAAVDKEAAARFVKAGLSGNEKLDRERAEGKTRERIGATRKFEELSRRVERKEVEEAEREEREEKEKERKKAENEEQVNRILEGFRSHGVKRKSDDESAGGSAVEKRKRGRRGRKGK